MWMLTQQRLLLFGDEDFIPEHTPSILQTYTGISAHPQYITDIHGNLSTPPVYYRHTRESQHTPSILQTYTGISAHPSILQTYTGISAHPQYITDIHGNLSTPPVYYRHTRESQHTPSILQTYTGISAHPQYITDIHGNLSTPPVYYRHTRESQHTPSILQTYTGISAHPQYITVKSLFRLLYFVLSISICPTDEEAPPTYKHLAVVRRCPLIGCGTEVSTDWLWYGGVH